MVRTPGAQVFAAAFFLGSLGACAAPGDSVGGSVAPLSYTGSEIFSDSTGTRQTAGGNPKSYDFRVTRGQPVDVWLTKINGNGTLRFDVSFSTDHVNWDASPNCVGVAPNGSGGNPVTCDDVALASGDGWGRVTVYVTQSSSSYSADFTADYEFHGPCDLATHACYGEDTITVNNIQRSSVKKAKIAGVLPGMYLGQSATVTIVRSHANVTVVNGAKFKYMNGNSETTVDFDCDAWGTTAPNTMVCTIENVQADGAIHVPLQRTNRNNTPARSATVTIERSGENGYVQPDRVWPSP
jgi:hypothetical protein